MMSVFRHGTTSRFERIVLVAILANALVALWGFIDHGHDELLENADLAILWFFAAELAARLYKARLGFFKSPWSCFDAAIIVVALLPIAGGGIAVARLARLARSAHLLRHVSHLRLWRLFRIGAVVRHARELIVGLAATGAVLLTSAAPAHADTPDTPGYKEICRCWTQGQALTVWLTYCCTPTAEPWTVTGSQSEPRSTRAPNLPGVYHHKRGWVPAMEPRRVRLGD